MHRAGVEFANGSLILIDPKRLPFLTAEEIRVPNPPASPGEAANQEVGDRATSERTVLQ
jgi:hypothetical protein